MQEPRVDSKHCNCASYWKGVDCKITLYPEAEDGSDFDKASEKISAGKSILIHHICRIANKYKGNRFKMQAFFGGKAYTCAWKEKKKSSVD